MPDIEFMKLKITQDKVGHTKVMINGIELTTVMNYTLTQYANNDEIPSINIELGTLTKDIELLIEKNDLKLFVNREQKVGTVSIKTFMDKYIEVANFVSRDGNFKTIPDYDNMSSTEQNWIYMVYELLLNQFAVFERSDK